ncbi:hypothetical protein DID73_01480 [Candidatus Marinamargulisbacteria bacterium SCGC AG-343-K17]|nr:hypothetical protein DID73_01480 [Candidatus Marinamargulisbacteria bacterium SCGC AG-343-K17]
MSVSSTGGPPKPPNPRVGGSPTRSPKKQPSLPKKPSGSRSSDPVAAQTAANSGINITHAKNDKAIVSGVLNKAYLGDGKGNISDFMQVLTKLNVSTELSATLKTHATTALKAFKNVEVLLQSTFDVANDDHLSQMMTGSLTGIVATCELLISLNQGPMDVYRSVKEKAQNCLNGLSDNTRKADMLDYVRNNMIQNVEGNQEKYFLGDGTFNGKGLTQVSLFFGDVDGLFQGAMVEQTAVSHSTSSTQPSTSRLETKLHKAQTKKTAQTILSKAKTFFSSSQNERQIDEMFQEIHTVIEDQTVSQTIKDNLKNIIRKYFSQSIETKTKEEIPIHDVIEGVGEKEQVLETLRHDYTNYKFSVFNGDVKEYTKKIKNRDKDLTDQPDWKKTMLNGTNISTDCFLTFWDYNPDRFVNIETEIDFLLKANSHFYELNQIKGHETAKKTKIKYSRRTIPDLNVRFKYSEDELKQNVTLQKTADNMTHRATFPNQGATCWVNAALTEVVHTDYLDSFLNAIDPTKLNNKKQKIFYKTFMTLINEARNASKNGPIQESTIKDFIDAFEYCESLCSFPGEGFRVRYKGDQAGTFFEKVHKLLDEGITPGEKKDGETDSQALERTIVEKHFQEYKVEQCTVFRTTSGKLKFQGSQLPTAQLEVSTFQAQGSVVANQLLSSPSELKALDDQLINFGGEEINCSHRIQLLANAPQKISLNIQRLNGAVPFNNESPIFFYQYDKQKNKLKKIVYKMNAAAIHTGGWHWVAESTSGGQVHTHDDNRYKQGPSGRDVYSHLILEKVSEEDVVGDMAAELIGTS